jgi:hypothetical protein
MFFIYGVHIQTMVNLNSNIVDMCSSYTYYNLNSNI